MRFLIVFLIIVLCVSVGGPLLRHYVLSKDVGNGAPPPLTPPLDASPADSLDSEQTGPAGKGTEPVETAGPKPKETFSILGEIIDVNEGTPIPHVQVFVVAWDEARVRPLSIFELDPLGMDMTDDAGRFEISNLREAPYDILAQHETFIQTEAATKIFVGREMDGEPVVVTMEEGGVVMGEVSFQGALLPGQQIRLAYPYRRHDGASVSTDDGGAYLFEGLYPGRVKIATSMSTDAGLIETAFTVRVESGKTTLLDLPLAGYDASIAGQVIPYDPGATYVVTATSNEDSGDDFVYTSKVAPDGTYSFPNMPYGRFRIVVDAQGEGGYLRGRDRRRLQALVRTFPGLEARHDFYFADSFTTQGYVPNVASNEPLTVLATKSMRITDLNPNILRVLHEATSTYYAFVDVNGGFRFDGLEPGTYQIIAESGPNRFGFATLHVAPRPSHSSRNRQPLAPLELWLVDS